ncbi:hypothetical protein QAD02_016498 [Eretmocerus hayati]|uniref:Uncharacterized protein n=1 Tax=Eretmocerus hayati TaxID=131215 RepID=A0ACC2PD20_9HYME|nr:hypothetical protein QAD02_016498 [Eretmocerus hayati]
MGNCCSVCAKMWQRLAKSLERPSGPKRNLVPSCASPHCPLPRPPVVNADGKLDSSVLIVCKVCVRISVELIFGGNLLGLRMQTIDEGPPTCSIGEFSYDSLVFIRGEHRDDPDQDCQLYMKKICFRVKKRAVFEYVTVFDFTMVWRIIKGTFNEILHWIIQFVETI